MKPVHYIPICGLRIPVLIGNETAHTDLKGAYGIYSLDDCAIWMAADCPPHAARFWETHEALHALLNLSGGFRALASSLGVDFDTADAETKRRWGVAEETFIRVITDHVMETFGPARHVGKK